ncbi:hypothetical protein L202_08102 [Cryptococcus amylolentus CBS 6039]|uniref:Uncharacterized protein n=2 Tax=Cryptococcus amylolentus TaxID=104669 RepID=A0A1E3HB80_9TREE|nr:hypothetical protein L202_08102 [Cryptococcus amylolentus CBS 6039]ODN73599.1 hypothetical protein L202_08102 [Cryptococcus amylolentus CBS 6039]
MSESYTPQDEEALSPLTELEDYTDEDEAERYRETSPSPASSSTSSPVWSVTSSEDRDDISTIPAPEDEQEQLESRYADPQRMASCITQSVMRELSHLPLHQQAELAREAVASW